MNYINSIKNRILVKDNKQLLMNIIGAIMVKGFAIMISFFTTPAYLNYFDNNIILGVWFTVLSILNWIINFDLGIGNGLRNKLVEAIAEKDNLKSRIYISSSYIIMGFIALCVAFVGWFAIGFCNWNMILKIDPSIILNSDLILFIRIVFCGIILQFWLKIITSILYALQRTTLSNSLILISNLFLFLYLTIGKSGDLKEDLFRLSIVHVLAMNIPIVIATVVVFAAILRNSIPSMKYYVSSYAKNIIKLGGSFFIIQINLMIINSFNQLLITLFYNAESVVDYQIYFKLFYLFTTFFTLITQPVWSAITKAYAEKRIEWIKKIYKGLNIIAVLGTMGCIVLVVFLQPILNLWLGEKSIEVNLFTSIVFTLYISSSLFMLSSTCIANGLGKLNSQIITSIVGTVIKLPLLLILSHFIHDWSCIILIDFIINLEITIMQTIALKKYL